MKKVEDIQLCDLSGEKVKDYERLYLYCTKITNLQYLGAEVLGKLCTRYGAMLYRYGSTIIMRYHGQVVSAILFFPHKLQVYEFPICESPEDEKKVVYCKSRFIRQLSRLFPDSAKNITITRFYGRICTND